MNYTTVSVIEYFNQDVDLKRTIEEIYRSSIDDYTFALGLKYFVQDAKNFSKEHKSMSTRRSIQWDDLASYYKSQFKVCKLEYTKFLFSFYQKKFVEDPKIMGCRKYSLVSVKNGNSTQQKITLRRYKGSV